MKNLNEKYQRLIKGYLINSTISMASPFTLIDLNRGALKR